MELNFEGLEMEKWNIPTDRPQRADEKNGAIYPFIMFIRLWLLICEIWEKWLIFIFSADDSKKIVTVCANYLRATERSYWVFSEQGMINRVWSYRSWVILGRNTQKLVSQQKIPKSSIFKNLHLANGGSKFNSPQHLLRKLSRIFRCTKIFCPNCDSFFTVISRIYKK